MANKIKKVETLEETEIESKNKKSKAPKEKKNKVKDAKIDNTKEDVATDVVNVQDIKSEKKRRFLDEVKSFFILAIIIGVVILGGWLFLKYAEPIEWKKDKKPKDEVKVSENENYKAISYVTKEENGYLQILNNKYIIETSSGYVKKIMDMELNVLYEATESESYVFAVGVDDKLYAITNTSIDEETVMLNLYVLENEKIVEVKEFSKAGITYKQLITDDYLVGVVGNNCYLNEDLESTCDTEVFTLDGKENVLEDVSLEGDVLFGVSEGYYIYTRNSKYVVVKNIKDGKYGLYDLTKHKMIVNTSYNDLYTTYNDSYVALKEDKVGIIDKKLKKLVDFEYDFIDIQKDYYVVSKNNKLAIMNNEYKLITGFDFPYVNYTDQTEYNGYTYRNSMYEVNSFTTMKIEDKYLLVNEIKDQSGYTYLAKNAYLIDNQAFKKVDVSSFGVEDLLYSYSKKSGKLVVYDNDLKEKAIIDLSDYDYSDYPDIQLVNGNTIVVTMDSELYFDYETGNELEGIQDVSYNLGELVINYTSSDSKVVVMNNKKEIASYTYKPLSNKKPYIELSDNRFYYSNGETYILVSKR